MNLYQKLVDHEQRDFEPEDDWLFFDDHELNVGEAACWFKPMESVNIRWCMSHRRETWSGRTTCVGMGGDLTNSCNVVDALLMVGEDSTP